MKTYLVFQVRPKFCISAALSFVPSSSSQLLVLLSPQSKSSVVFPPNPILDISALPFRQWFNHFCCCVSVGSCEHGHKPSGISAIPRVQSSRCFSIGTFCPPKAEALSQPMSLYVGHVDFLYSIQLLITTSIISVRRLLLAQAHGTLSQ